MDGRKQNVRLNPSERPENGSKLQNQLIEGDFIRTNKKNVNFYEWSQQKQI